MKGLVAAVGATLRGQPILMPYPDIVLANRHGVAALIGSTAPRDADYVAAARDAAVRSLGQIAETRAIVHALTGADIPVVTFKGPALSQLAYGDPGRRWSQDIDLLVPVGSVRRAIEVVQGAGYHAPALDVHALDAQIRDGKEFGFLAPERTLLELQWAFAPRQDGVGLQPGHLQRTTVDIGGSALPAFARPDLAVACAIHAAREGWWRLLWTADLAGLVRQDFDWDRLVDLAERYRVGTIVRVSVILARDLFEVTVPAYVDRWLAVDGKATKVAARWTGDQPPRTGTLIGLHDGWLDDAASAARWALTPTDGDRAMAGRLGAPAPLVRPLRLARDGLARGLGG